MTVHIAVAVFAYCALLIGVGAASVGLTGYLPLLLYMAAMDCLYFHAPTICAGALLWHVRVHTSRMVFAVYAIPLMAIAVAGWQFLIFGGSDANLWVLHAPIQIVTVLFMTLWRVPRRGRAAEMGSYGHGS